MGWRDWISIFAKRDKDQQIADEARGVSIGAAPSEAGSSWGVSGNEGYTALHQELAVDSDLMRRYADYENMDDYVETCLAGDSLIFTVERGWVQIHELVETQENFHVLAYDQDLKSLVPAKACDARMTGKPGHNKPMVRVILDDGRAIRCTADHLFMGKDGFWVEAGNLSRGDRLMPGAVRMRSLNSAESQPYWQVHQPHADSKIEGGRKDRQQRWTWVHRLVAELINGDVGAPHVHHKDGNQLNNAPENLEGVSLSEHAHRHIADLDNSEYFPEWTEGRRAAMALRMRGNTYRRGSVMSDEARRKISDSNRGKPKDEEWRKKIGLAQPNRIDLGREDVEAALESGGNIAGAARILGVSWSKAKRAAVEHDLLSASANHRVMSVEPIEGGEPVYDLTVPGYANFVCNGVVVHNSAALDYYSDDSTIPDSVHGKTIWGISRDRVIRDIVDDCMHRRCRIEEDIWVAVRTLSKYGNCFAEILVNEKGVVGLNWLPVPTMRRIVDEKGSLVGFVQDASGAFNFEYGVVVEHMKKGQLPTEKEDEPGKAKVTFFHPWQVVHWRLRSKMMRAQYGYSVLDSARWIWKRLMLMEDTALVQKLTRAPGRFAFYVDTGDLPPKEAMALVKKVKRGYKKVKLVDPSTGKLDFRYNPLCVAADTEIPMLDGTQKTVVEMAEAFKSGDDQWVYGVDRKNGNKIVPGKVVWAGKTRKNAELVRVTLDNGESFRVTPDHKCVLRSGEVRDAEDLACGDSLMPLRRTASSFDKGDSLDGYEKVYDPATKKYVYTHRMVARACGIYEKGKLIHHDQGKLNNDPRFLKSMTRKEHSEHHCRLGQMGGAALAEARKHDPALDQRLKDAASRTLKKLHEDPGYRDRKSAMISETNRRRDSARHIREYNRSPKHAQDNAIRSDAMKAYWTDDAREAYSEFRTISYSREFIDVIERFVRQNPGSSADAVAGFVSSDKEALRLLNDGSPRKIEKAHRHLLLKAYRSHGYKDFSEFKESVCSFNHKVVSVERLKEREDTYTLTVDGCHNFGVAAGVVVCNSPHEDFWIPTRGGKESTRIETIAGPDVQMMDDVEYFQGKLVTAVKVPRGYLGIGDDRGETDKTLSAADVRFARACMRVQREFIMGMRKVLRIHMAALNIDPDSIEWKLKMTVPSAIFEMQQIEVMNAQAALASSMAEWASKPWILQHVFHFTDDDASLISKDKEDEVDGEMKKEASTQADIMRMYPQLQDMPEGKGAAGLSQESKMGSELIGLKKVLQEAGQTFPEVLKRFEKLDRRMVEIEKTIRKRAISG